jgi:hypothetical protein
MQICINVYESYFYFETLVIELENDNRLTFLSFVMFGFELIIP